MVISKLHYVFSPIQKTKTETLTGQISVMASLNMNADYSHTDGNLFF